jgi:uncharacterized membrane protein required for colicin V production
VTILLLLLLAWGFYTGYRRGFALQAVYSVGIIISLVIASKFYKNLAKGLDLWVPYPSPTSDTRMIFFSQKMSFDLEKAFYAGVAFIGIFILCYLLIRLLGLFAHALMYQSILGKADKTVAGIFGAGAVLIALVMVTILLSMVPMNFVQNLLSENVLSKLIIEHTPVFSSLFHKLWITNILG